MADVVADAPELGYAQSQARHWFEPVVRTKKESNVLDVHEGIVVLTRATAAYRVHDAGLAYNQPAAITEKQLDEHARVGRLGCLAAPEARTRLGPYRGWDLVVRTIAFSRAGRPLLWDVDSVARYFPVRQQPV